MDFLTKITVFLMHIYLVVSQEELGVEYYCGNKPADVVFLLDSSNSIWGPHFREQLQFVKSITDMFTIGKNVTRVGVVSYSHDIREDIGLDDFYEKEKLMDAIADIRQYRGYNTNTKKAIQYARKHMFGKHNHRDKNKVARIIVVLTDGRSSNTLRTIWESIKAKNEGIRMISIGVGDKIYVRELMMIASRPTEDHMFLVKSFNMLTSIKKVLAVQTCKVTPKTTTSTTTSTTTTTTTTTTPTTTTTTTPSTTTESLYAAAQRICYGDGLTDVVFAFDSSNNVRPHEFRKQLEFAQRITKTIVIGQNRSRVGAILYSDQVQNLIDLPEYETQEEVVRALDKVEKSAGGTRMDEAIRYIRTKSFRRSVSRHNAAQVAIIITASPTSSLHLTKKQAHVARKAGITLIPVGIGDVNIEEMRAIAGTKDDTYQHILPTFDDLEYVMPKVAINTCEVTEPAITVSDMSCGSRQEADLMFFLDSINAGRKNTKKVRAFIQDLMNDLDIDKDKIQVGLMTGDECDAKSKSSTGFTLGAMTTKEDALAAITEKQEVDFGEMLKSMRRSAFSSRHGGRRQARKIAILIIDGNLDAPLKALKEAKKARIHGIEVYVVQVGDDEPQKELMMMSDSPYGDSKNFFKVSNYNELKSLKQRLWDSLCDEL